MHVSILFIPKNICHSVRLSSSKRPHLHLCSNTLFPSFFHYFQAALKYSHLLSVSFWQSRKRIASYTLIIPHSTLSVQDKKQQPYTASIIHTFTADHFQNLIGVPSSAAKFHQKFTSYFRQHSHNISRCFQTVFSEYLPFGDESSSCHFTLCFYPYSTSQKTPGRESLFFSKAFPLSF